MNAQYPITTTSKYNFPLPNGNSQFPQQFIELSVQSLRKTPPLSFYSEDCSPITTLSKLAPNSTKTNIIAIDVSSLKLGETKTGTLLATRGAIVWKQNKDYRYLRLGPFPFHITPRNQNTICNLLYPNYQSTHTKNHIAPNILHIQTKLTIILEQWIQTFANQMNYDSIILWDGSLTASTLGASSQIMKKTLKEARDHSNTILAFSKMTRLFLCGNRITDLVYRHSPPCLLKIENYPTFAGQMHLLGNVYVAKLNRGGYAFRLDVDKKCSHVQAVEAVQKLLGNDLILQSYPETLRLAHIYSTFTASEVIGLQRWIAKEGNLKIVTKPSIRRLLFGRFGKGPEG